MKIGWLQDFNIFLPLGGAEANDAIMFREGLKRNHELCLLNTDTSFDHSYDLLIISNCTSFDKKRLKDMCDSTPHVWFFHDYIYCNFRTNFPRAEKCKECYNLEYWKGLFLSSKSLIFLSPLHRSSYFYWLPSLETIRSAVIPSPVDITKFVPGEKEQKNIWLNINGLFRFKGQVNVAKFMFDNPDKQFRIVGGNPESVQLPVNVELLDRVGPREIIKHFQECEHYFELPHTAQPYNRTMAEAYLCGCYIHTNELMGFVSYPWDYNDRNKVREIIGEAPVKFWEHIEEAVK